MEVFVAIYLPGEGLARGSLIQANVLTDRSADRTAANVSTHLEEWGLLVSSPYGGSLLIPLTKVGRSPLGGN